MKRDCLRGFSSLDAPAYSTEKIWTGFSWKRYSKHDQKAFCEVSRIPFVKHSREFHSGNFPAIDNIINRKGLWA